MYSKGVQPLNPFSALKKRVFVFIVIALLVAPYLQAVASAESGQAYAATFNTYIHPAFYNDEFWEKGVLTTSPTLDEFFAFAEKYVELKGGKILRPEEPYARAILVLPKDVNADKIGALSKVVRITGVYPTHVYTIVTAWITPSSLNKIKSLGFVAAVLPDIRIDELIAYTNGYGEPLYDDLRAAKETLEELFKQGKIAQVENLLEGGKGGKAWTQTKPSTPVEPTPTQASGFGAYHYTVNLTKAVNVWTKYGIRGQNAAIAIVDTGVDYASPGLGLGAIARDEYGLPLILDADGVGLVLTPLNATPINSTHVRVNLTELYFFLQPYYVFKSTTGFAYVAGCWLDYNLTTDWQAPSEVINSTVTPHFGLVGRTLYTPLGTIAFTVPAIIYDGNSDGFYDSILLDMSTAYYYLYQAAQACNVSSYFPPPPVAAPDYSFADETPITFGNEIAALDLDGDGLYDFSVGTLAGYVNDASGIILLQIYGGLSDIMAGIPEGYGIMVSLLWDVWGFESLGYIWPGMDVWTGQYFDLEYDFHSHGTFCAGTAAGRPAYAYTGYGPYNGWSLIPGQAPEAKVAAASSLFLGNTLTAIYFFSGFDQVTPYGEHVITPVPFTSVNPWIAFSGGTWFWQYTGNHQVDITSNSYGVSGWAIWGWASGLDPLSVVFDYTAAISNTLHFVAVGNGGPGWGTIASPGASTLSVGVGAATEFTYRPFYGYLPGGNRQVISWSNRGPAESFFAKPDILGIGSFAFATGRPWDALGWGYLTGFLAFDLFGGTSQATPMVAGVAALVVSAYKSVHGTMMPAPLLKTVLMSAAEPVGYDAFSQGAGFVNALGAVKTILEGGTIVYNKDFMQAYNLMINDDVTVFTYGGDTSGMTWYEPKVLLAPDMRLYRQQLVIKGSGTYRIHTVKLGLEYEDTLCGAVGVTMVANCVNNRVMLDFGNMGYFDLRILAIIEPQYYYDYDLIEISMVYPYEFFDSAGRYANYTGGIYLNGIELWAWFDLNGDNIVQRNETARIQYDIRGANAFHLQVSQLRKQINEIKKLVSLYTGVDVTNYPVKLLLVYRIWFNDWSGTEAYTYADVIVKGYKFTRWRYVRAIPSYAYVRGERTITVYGFRSPVRGVEEGYIVIENVRTKERILVPVTLLGAYKMYSPYAPMSIPAYRTLLLREKTSFYKNYMLRGAFDYTWRYESGDWRVIPILITSPATKYLLIEVKWPVASENYASNLDVMLFGPYTYYMAYLTAGPINDTNGEPLYPVAVMRVHGLELGAELTYPFQYFFDEPEPGYSRIIVPVNGPGLYRLVVRNIQFSGELGIEEPYEIKITPVIARIFPSKIYTVPGRSNYLRLIIYVRAGLGNTDFSLRFVNEFIKSIDGQLYYGNASRYFESEESILFARSYRYSTVAVARIFLKTLPTATPGTYKLYYVFSFSNLPITSVGYIVQGMKYYYFYWNNVPAEITVTVR